MDEIPNVGVCREQPAHLYGQQVKTVQGGTHESKTSNQSFVCAYTVQRHPPLLCLHSIMRPTSVSPVMGVRFPMWWIGLSTSNAALLGCFLSPSWPAKLPSTAPGPLDGCIVQVYIMRQNLCSFLAPVLWTRSTEPLPLGKHLGSLNGL